MRALTFLGISLVLTHLVLPLASMAQEPGKVARIGLLGPAAAANDPMVEAFKQGLRELGYVDGQNIRIEYRDAAAELVRLKVDVIVATSQRAVAAKQATATIPIVMPIITDPVRLGLVASLARPGGNATGFATQNPELPGKWMELVKEAVPNISRVAILFHPTYDGGVQFEASENAARSLSVRLQAVNVERSEDFRSRLRTWSEAGLKPSSFRHRPCSMQVEPRSSTLRPGAGCRRFTTRASLS